MAEFTNQDLKSARMAAGITQWQMAQRVHMSESSVVRIESGEKQPSPDEVDSIADALGDPSIWHQWMISHFDSYRRRYLHTKPLDLPVSLMRTKQELTDVLALQERIERDSIDGHIDDGALKAKYITEIKEAMGAMADCLQKLI